MADIEQGAVLDDGSVWTRQRRRQLARDEGKAARRVRRVVAEQTRQRRRYGFRS